MTKTRLKLKKRENNEVKKAQFVKATKAFNSGKFKSLRKCAEHYKIPKSTLHDLVVGASEFKGSGKKLHCLTPIEESKIVNHVKWRASIGCGLDWRQWQSIIQEVLLEVKEANPERITGYENTGQLPNIMFVRRLAERHNLTLRRTSEISKGRIISLANLNLS